MTAEENKALARRYFDEVVNQRNLALMDEIFTPEALAAVSIKESLIEFINAFPDLQTTIEDMVAAGDSVLISWVDRGTHQGEWRGIHPTGKRITLKGKSLIRVAGGKIVNVRSEADYSGLMRQLGAAPSPVGEISTDKRRALEQVLTALGVSDQDGITDILEVATQSSELHRQKTLEDAKLRLQEAKQMLEAGLITAEEYEETKAQILSEETLSFQ